MASLLIILLSAVLTTIVVLSHVPKWRPFDTVADLFDDALGIALAVAAAQPMAVAITYALSRVVLAPQGLNYLRTPLFFAVVLLVVPLVESLLRRAGRSPVRPGFPLLMTTNCAIPGVAFIADAPARGFGDALIMAVLSAIAFAGLLLALASLYERLRHADVPRAFRDAPLALITVGIIALACMGFTGIVRE
jgi:Na+-translocating ferredoxin:NAD+ oxidoreductase subunit A